MSTMLPIVSVEPVLGEDGYYTFADGRRVKAPPKKFTTNDQTASVGTPEKGKGKAGSNIFRAQAVEHIVNQRGMGGGTNPNAWDEGDIGWWGRSQGVTVEDLQNLTNTQQLPNLERTYNTQLIEAGVTNADGTQRTVQWGDTAESLDQMIASSVRNTSEIDKAEANVNAVKNDLITQNRSNTQANTQRTQNVEDTKDERDFNTRSQGAQFDFELSKAELDNQAKEDRYKLELARYDARERRDSISALIAGLATLGAGFAI